MRNPCHGIHHMRMHLHIYRVNKGENSKTAADEIMAMSRNKLIEAYEAMRAEKAAAKAAGK